MPATFTAPAPDTEAGAREGPGSLPILIAARDEELLLPRTLDSMAAAARRFSEEVPGVRPRFLVCDNGSRDDTPRVLEGARERLGSEGIVMEVVSEPHPGKERAIRRLLDLVEERCPRAARLVFADADVEWEPDTLLALWRHLAANPGLDIVGGNLLPRESRWTVWSVADTVPYLDYGAGAHGLGRHMRFAIGMTYVGRAPRVAELHREVPLDLIDEDLAVNVLAGAGRVGIAPGAVVRFQAARSFAEFWSMRYRHIRGIYELERWVASRIDGGGGTWPGRGRVSRRARREAKRTVREIVETDTVSLARSLLFERHRAPVGGNGRVVLKRGIPVVLSFRHFAAILGVMLPVYSAMKAAAWFDDRRGVVRRGWRPWRGE